MGNGLLRRVLPVLFLLFFLPATLIAAGIFSFELRLPLLFLSFCLTVLYSFYRGFTLGELGIRSDNLGISLRVNLVLTLPFYLIVSSPLQEFLFRGFLFAEMRASGIRSAWVLVLLSAFTFSFVHIIYGDWKTLFLTFGIGILWGGIYYRLPNLAGVSIFHGVVGLLAVLAGVARNM